MTTKNNILYALSTLWILLFTACSQEEVKQSPSESNRIRISATLPQDAATRTALPLRTDTSYVASSKYGARIRLPLSSIAVNSWVTEQTDKNC